MFLMCSGYVDAMPCTKQMCSGAEYVSRRLQTPPDASKRSQTLPRCSQTLPDAPQTFPDAPQTLPRRSQTLPRQLDWARFPEQGRGREGRGGGICKAP